MTPETTFTRLSLPMCAECLATGWAIDARYLVGTTYLCGHHGRSRKGAVAITLEGPR